MLLADYVNAPLPSQERGLAAKSNSMIKKYLFVRNHDAQSNGGGGPVITDVKQSPEKEAEAEEQPDGTASADQIAAWKTSYPKGIYAVIIDGHVAYFQNPNRKHMNASMSKASADHALDMYETLAKLTMIGGSDQLIKDDELFFGLTQHLKTKMDGKKGQLVNL